MRNNQDKRNCNPQKLPSGQKSWKWKELNAIAIAFHCLMAIQMMQFFEKICYQIKNIWLKFVVY